MGLIGGDPVGRVATVAFHPARSGTSGIQRTVTVTPRRPLG